MIVVDLFAGCGGLSLGFQNAGFQVTSAFEYWDIAATCYALNFNHPVIKTDLSDVENAIGVITDYSPDIIIGGPPCQDFSHAGKRIEAGRAHLTECYAEIIRSIKPKAFVMENVARAASTNTYARAREILSADYGLTEIVLDASFCGVPQKRKRFFCIGILGEKDGAIKPYIEKRLSTNRTTVKDYLGNSLGIEYYYYHPRNYNRRAIFSINEPAPTMRGQNRPVSKGYKGNRNDPCPMNGSIRTLTTEERSLIQTFPSDYKWCGTKTEKEQMIGNAVPVKLAEFVGKALKEYLEDSLQQSSGV